MPGTWAGFGLAVAAVIAGLTILATPGGNQGIGYGLTVVGLVLAIALGGILLDNSTARPAVSHWLWRRIPYRRPMDQLGITVTRGPNSPLLTNLARFSTSGTVHEVKTTNTSYPTRVRFLKPRVQIIRRDELPALVECRRDFIEIRSWVDGGFIVDERKSRGDDVEVEFFFD